MATGLESLLHRLNSAFFSPADVVGKISTSELGFLRENNFTPTRTCTNTHLNRSQRTVVMGSVHQCKVPEKTSLRAPASSPSHHYKDVIRSSSVNPNPICPSCTAHCLATTMLSIAQSSAHSPVSEDRASCSTSSSTTLRQASVASLHHIECAAS